MKTDLAIPIFWGSEQKGMQTGEVLGATAEAVCQYDWLELRDKAIETAQKLGDYNLHKSLINRILEPWSWITTVITATEWDNFFLQRCHSDAEPHMRYLACAIRQAMRDYEPQVLGYGEWHLPYIEKDDRNLARDIPWSPEPGWSAYDPHYDYGIEVLKRASVARCARVSYVAHGSKLKSLSTDLGLFNRLVQGSGFGHWSPMEHPAMCDISAATFSGPFRGYRQFRKEFVRESGIH